VLRETLDLTTEETGRILRGSDILVAIGACAEKEVIQ
jgi:hypothetical protein